MASSKFQPWLPWALVLPSAAALGVVYYLPLLTTLGTSFTQGATGFGVWVGFDNYLTIGRSEAFWRALGFTLGLTALATALDLVLGLAMAQLSFSVPKPLSWVVRGLIIIPWAIPQVIQASLWRWLLSSDAGPLSDLILRWGLAASPPLFSADPGLAFWSLVVASSWRGASIAAFFLMGALTLVPKELTEAAQIDGAGGWRRFRHITLPLILPIVLVATLFRTLEGLRVFDLIQGLTGGGPGATTTSLSFYSYQAYFRFGQYGIAAAYGVLNFLLVAIPGIFYIRWIQHRMGEGRQ